MTTPFEPDHLIENGMRYTYQGRVWTDDNGMRLGLAQSPKRSCIRWKKSLATTASFALASLDQTNMYSPSMRSACASWLSQVARQTKTQQKNSNAFMVTFQFIRCNFTNSSFRD